MRKTYLLSAKAHDRIGAAIIMAAVVTIAVLGYHIYSFQRDYMPVRSAIRYSTGEVIPQSVAWMKAVCDTKVHVEGNWYECYVKRNKS